MTTNYLSKKKSLISFTARKKGEGQNGKSLGKTKGFCPEKKTSTKKKTARGGGVLARRRKHRPFKEGVY